jgi:hypothetical protein
MMVEAQRSGPSLRRPAWQQQQFEHPTCRLWRYLRYRCALWLLDGFHGVSQTIARIEASVVDSRPFSELPHIQFACIKGIIATALLRHNGRRSGIKAVSLD